MYGTKPMVLAADVQDFLRWLTDNDRTKEEVIMVTRPEDTRGREASGIIMTAKFRTTDNARTLYELALTKVR